MKKSFIVLLSVASLSFTSFSQEITGESVLNVIQNCECDEIIVNAGGIEKKYTHSWIDSAELEDGFIKFSKGSAVHRWNPEKVVFIEKGGSFVRLFLERTR